MYKVFLQHSLLLKTIAFAFYLIGAGLFISIFACYFSPVNFPFLSFVALLFPLLWLVNIIFLLFFVISKSRLAIVSLMLILLGGFQASMQFNMVGSENINWEADAFRLVSYNTGNPDKTNVSESRKRIFGLSEFKQADVVCLQEFVPKYAQKIEFLENFDYSVSVDFEGIVNSKANGLSIYTNFEIIDSGWLKQEEENTYALWSHLVVDHDTLTLINVQLQSIRLTKEELQSMTDYMQVPRLPSYIYSIYSKLKRAFLWRDEQVKKLQELIASSQYTVVLCGDFNDPPSSYTYHEISKLLNDTFLEKGRGFGSTYAGGLPFLRIDYIMVSEGTEVKAYQKMSQTYSDHYPLFVELDIDSTKK